MRLRRRLSWIGLVLGAVAGLAFGLSYAWIVDPVTYYDADPADLRADLREDYLVLIATSYELTGDLARAQARLASLGQAGNPQAVAALADRLYSTSGHAETVRALALLANALGASSEAAVAYLPTATPTIAPSPTFTPTPLPTTPPTATPTAPPTATPTPEATPTPDVRPPYRVVERRQVCDDPDVAGIIQVYVQDVEGQGLPNVEVQVSWEGGQDRFFTGLKPEIDAGYADFQMSTGQVYDVVVWGTQVGDISTEGCPSGPAGWQLIFRRRE
ncbi:MAG: hypothetical protein JSV36_22625 [Anaerolineae bacterium]|nr:MAG: hypothetical protein JSV36_22625 [Anaerolineae bacterium]